MKWRANHCLASIHELVMCLLNFTAWKNDIPVLTNLTLICNGIAMGHTIMETFYFKAMRFEVFGFFAFFMIVNMAWAAKEQYESTRVKKLEDPLQYRADVIAHDVKQEQLQDNITTSTSPIIVEKKKVKVQ